jgi:CBS domain-containing protein
MHRGVVTCQSEWGVRTVARLMAAHRIHAVVVTPSADGQDWGIVSDLDLVAAAADGAVADVAVGRIASAPRLFLRLDDTIARAAQLMREHETHHVVVGRGGDRPLGIVSTLDVADVLAELPQPTVVT